MKAKPYIITASLDSDAMSPNSCSVALALGLVVVTDYEGSFGQFARRMSLCGSP